MQNNDPKIPSDSERRFRERLQATIAEVDALTGPSPKAKGAAEILLDYKSQLLVATESRLAELERAFAVLERLARHTNGITLRSSEESADLVRWGEVSQAWPVRDTLLEAILAAEEA